MDEIFNPQEEVLDQGQAIILRPNEHTIARVKELSFCFALIAELEDGDLLVWHITPSEFIASGQGNDEIYKDQETAARNIKKIGIKRSFIIYNSAFGNAMDGLPSTANLTPEELMRRTFRVFDIPVDAEKVPKYYYNMGPVFGPQIHGNTMDVVVAAPTVNIEFSEDHQHVETFTLEEGFSNTK